MDEIVKCLKDQYWKSIKKKPNVVGYSGKLQPRIKNGTIVPGSKVFRVYVEKKDNTISCKDMVPTSLVVKNCECGISTVDVDVVAIGKIRYMDDPIEVKTVPSDHQKKYRPYMAGTSTDNYKSTACTGNVPYKKKIGIATGTNLPIYKIYISGNNHCFGLEGNASLGDDIIQPSTYDGGKKGTDTLAKYSFNVPTQFGGGTKNWMQLLIEFLSRKKSNPINIVDIAFAEPLNVNDISYSVYGVEGKITGKGNHNVGTAIIKSGRTSGVTEGIIVDEDWEGEVQGKKGIATYDDCVLAQLHCEGGDSGSPIVSKSGTGNLLYHGALFAGSDAYTVYCKVQNIEKLASVELAIL
jgi:hypothetical protein